MISRPTGCGLYRGLKSLTVDWSAPGGVCVSDWRLRRRSAAAARGHTSSPLEDPHHPPMGDRSASCRLRGGPADGRCGSVRASGSGGRGWHGFFDLLNKVAGSDESPGLI